MRRSVRVGPEARRAYRERKRRLECASYRRARQGRRETRGDVGDPRAVPSPAREAGRARRWTGADSRARGHSRSARKRKPRTAAPSALDGAELGQARSRSERTNTQTTIPVARARTASGSRPDATIGSPVRGARPSQREQITLMQSGRGEGGSVYHVRCRTERDALEQHATFARERRARKVVDEIPSEPSRRRSHGRVVV